MPTIAASRPPTGVIFSSTLRRNFFRPRRQSVRKERSQASQVGAIRNEWKFINTMNAGGEWLVDAQGCSPEQLRDRNTIQQVCNQIIADLDLQVVGDPMWHVFPDPGGVTGLYLLTESHLACHTYPEIGLATFNLYCCRPRHSWAWEDHLSDSLGAERVRVRYFQRGSDQVNFDSGERLAFEMEVREH